MGAVEVAGALADPEHVRRAVVPTAGGRVLAGERLLVAEHQGLVAGPHVDLAERGVRLGVHPGGAHEAQGTIDLERQLVVLLPDRAGRHELLRPGVDPVEGGEATLGEGAQQVERRRRLVVRLHEPLGGRHPGGGGGRRVVDDVAAERRQVVVADALEVGRPRLGELAGDASDLDDRHAQRIGEHDRHLQDDAQLLTDVVGGEVLEALGAVARLEQEGVARRHLGEPVLERSRLAGEHQRGIAVDLLERPVEVGLVGPRRLLLDRERPPASPAPTTLP